MEICQFVEHILLYDMISIIRILVQEFQIPAIFKDFLLICDYGSYQDIFDKWRSWYIVLL